MRAKVIPAVAAVMMSAICPCPAVAGAEAPSGRTVTKLSGPGWTCDGEPVCVPHTWNATDACDGPGDTVSWSGYGGGDSAGGRGYLRKRAVYRRSLPAARPGRRYFLKCDGVSVISDVSINGRKVGSHVGAFTAFAFDVTEFLRTDGESELEVMADNRWTELTQPMAADYSVYGGVYRDVWLLETDPVCIDPVTDGADGVRILADAKTGEVTVDVAVLGGTNEVRRFRVENPKLWSPEEPNLYTYTATVSQRGSTDSVTVRYAFRTFEFRDGLFYLNGRQRQLRGVNRHQDRAGKGWAVSAADEEEDIRLMKEMGVDALRTAHYPASRHVYDLCDELGIIAWCEYPNVNRLTFSEAFERNMLRQVREMVMQRCNHASIAHWGIFNELYNGETWMRPKSAELLKMMARTQELILSLDRTRTVVGVMGEAGIPALNAIPQEYGLNVYPKWYSFMTMREMLDYLFALSGRKTFSISEYGVGASVKQHGDPSVAVKAAGMWHPEEYQAYRMHDNLLEMMKEPRVWGTYVWAMFDFGADNRMEGDRHGINDKGLVTHDRRIRKDAFYLYKANWTKTPVLHLVGGRMTAVATNRISVLGFSNVGEVTLRVNGKDLGSRRPDLACGVFWPSVELDAGANRIELSAGGLKDTAVWTCAASSGSAGIPLGSNTNAQPMKLAYEYDITREKVPTAATLRRVVDIVSSLGYRQLQLYFKDNFAYPEHPLIWKDRAHITPEEVKELDAYCVARGLELVPYQSSFGHLEPWMAHERYRKFAEHPSGRFYCPDLDHEFKSMAVCPTDPRSMEFLNGLFDVLLPCFSSKYANLGCDEVWDLHADTGRSGAELRARGVGRVYFDFIMKLRDSLKTRGRTLMFWSDIIKHYPELVKELPSDVIALEWGYEAHSPWAVDALKAAPCSFYLCPGTSSWNSFFGRHANMRANVYSAWRAGRRSGAEGILLTDWGDDGHPQPWLVSLPALVYTAALVKDGRQLTDAEIAAKVDEICGCRVGGFLIRAANAYLKVPDPAESNGNQLYRMAADPAEYRMPEHLTTADFEAAVRQLREAAKLRDLGGAPEWVRDDVALMDLLADFVARRVAGEKGPLSSVYRERYTALWLRQNRPGGIEQSLGKVFGAFPPATGL